MKILDKNFFKSLKIIGFFRSVFQRFGPREKFIAGLFALVIAGSLLALGVQFYISKTTAVPARGGEYREAVVGTPRFINPVLASTNEADRDLLKLTHAGLMKYTKDGEITEDLAASYELSEDGKVYTFKLKENLTWQDGAPLTAEDVLFTVNLIQNPQYSSPLFQSWQGVEAQIKDDRTIVFTLSAPYASFIENTTLPIMPRHIWDDVSAGNFALTDLNLSPVSAGRYKVEKFTKDNSGLISSYTLRVNNNYHGKKPFINRIILKYYSSEEEAIRAYNSGAVDGISILSPANINLIENTDTLKLHEFEMPRYFAIFINQDKNEILENSDLRKAMALAINRDAIIDNALNGMAEKVNSPIPQNLSRYYNENIESANYNPEEARALLDGANFKDTDGDGVREQGENGQKLSFSFVTANRPELVGVAQMVQEQLADVGITVNTQIIDIPQLQQNFIKTRNYELLMFGEILGAIPDPFSFWHSSQKNDPGLNLANYENEEIDTLLEEARQERDEKTRIEKYKEFQQKLTQDIPAIFLYNPNYLYPMHNRVQGVSSALITDTSHRFVDVENWYIETNRVF